MRIYLRLAAAAASALVIALPMTAADAATVHVLTINKKGGPAVKPGAILKAHLLTGTKAVFSLPLGSGTEKLKCSSGKLVTKVATNPVRPGKAAGSVTAQSFSTCVVTGVSGATLKSLTSVNMPFHFTVSDATGDPVVITGQSTTKPVNFTATVAVQGFGTVTCSYKSAKVVGHATAGNTVTFTKQKFTFASGNTLFCPTAAFFSATFGPVRDTSVIGSPRVFVN